MYIPLTAQLQLPLTLHKTYILDCFICKDDEKLKQGEVIFARQFYIL